MNYSYTPKGVYQREHNRLMEVEISKHPWGFECTKNGCDFSVCATSEQHAQLIELTHPCPYTGGITHYGWSIVATLVEQVWEKLDADMLSLKQPGPNTDYTALKARLRAFAEVLAIFMNPHFTTADEIAREALRRYENRLDPEYCTPGLERLRYAPPPGTADKYVTPSGESVYTPPKSTRQNALEKALDNLTDQQIEVIKTFAGNGFPHDVIAKGQGVSVQVVEAVLKG